MGCPKAAKSLPLDILPVELKVNELPDVNVGWLLVKLMAPTAPVPPVVVVAGSWIAVPDELALPPATTLMKPLEPEPLPEVVMDPLVVSSTCPPLAPVMESA